MIGYATKTLKVQQAGVYNVKLDDNSAKFGTAVVTGHKTKYTRKNNPAVELMRKVIEAKKMSDLKLHDYYSIHKYSKLTFAFNDVTDKIFEEGKFKKMPFLKDHVETCNETGKLILPISVDENVTREIYRRTPHADKSIVLGQRSSGINDLFNTGDILSTVLKDCFTDVNIYEDEVRLLQYPFVSPISSHSGISFIVSSLKTPPTSTTPSASVSTSRPTTPRTSASPVRSTSLPTPPTASKRPTWAFRAVPMSISLKACASSRNLRSCPLANKS